MANPYTQVRRQWRDVDPERDLKALWAADRLDSPEKIADTLRITELAIRVSGWETVKGWAREQLGRDAILHAQLVELAMRALDQADDPFLLEVTAALSERSVANVFRFWFTLFTARHSHRGERLFRAQLGTFTDHQLVKYRRWIRRIFRRLRFRCETPRERSIGAVAFSMPAEHRKSGHPSEAFDAFFEAAKVASSWGKTKGEKPVTPARQAELFAVAASALGIASVAEGIRTSARIPRTLGYLAAMAPKMSDTEIRRSLRAFDAHLATADHKKASEQVVAVAAYLRERLSKMEVSLEEWCKILPYSKSPTLVRVLEELIGVEMGLQIGALSPRLPVAPVPVVDLGIEARGARVGFLLGYLLHRAHPRSAALWIDGQRAVRAISHPTALWPYGIGILPPARSWQDQPDHPHRIGLQVIRDQFPAVAKDRRPPARPLDPVLAALRWQLWQRQLLEGQTSVLDVPVLVLGGPPAAEEREALAVTLDCFAAAALVLFEERWDRPLDRPHLVHLTAPRSLDGALGALRSALPELERAAAGFASRKEEVDRQTRALLLAPPPPVGHCVRVPGR